MTHLTSSNYLLWIGIKVLFLFPYIMIFCQYFVVGKMHWSIVASCGDEYIVNKREKYKFIFVYQSVFTLKGKLIRSSSIILWFNVLCSYWLFNGFWLNHWHFRNSSFVFFLKQICFSPVTVVSDSSNPNSKRNWRDLEEEWRLFPRTGSMIPFVVENWGLCELSEGSEALSRRGLCVQSLWCGFYGLQPPSVKSQTFMPQNPSLEFKPLISRT